MKRQADGVSCESNEAAELDTAKESSNVKRIKLLKNESLLMDFIEEKSVMDVSSNESSHNHNGHSSSVSNNGSFCEHPFEKVGAENNSVQNEVDNNSAENSLNHITNNCNGSHDETTVKISASDSEIIPEIDSDCHKNSLTISENTASDDKESEPPVLNHCDFQNNESTDSFQSEGFETHSNKGELNEAPNELTSQVQCNDEEDSSSESDLKKSNIDVENLSLSHLEVTELEGHMDSVFSVAADGDFILSASADTTVKVWNIERKINISTFSGHSNTVTSLLLLNPNQSKIIKKKMSLTKVSRIAITGSLDCHIKLWSVLEGKELLSVYTFNGITCIGYLESECLVVVGTEGGKLELWNLSSAKAIVSLRAHDNKVTDVKIKDNFIYSVSVDGSVKVWSYEDDDLYPIYARKRKEISSDKTGFEPAQWKTLTISDSIMYLGSNTSSIKVLDWRAGRLTLFKNQTENLGVCDCVLAKENVLFSTCYDSCTGISGVNVWKLPEMTYVCTFTGTVPYISSLAVVQKDTKLKMVIGGDKLFVCEFDFSRPPKSEEHCSYYVQELEMIGCEINEKSVETKNAENNKSHTSISEDTTSSNRWCKIM